jgi:hypothetical protein
MEVDSDDPEIDRDDIGADRDKFRVDSDNIPGDRNESQVVSNKIPVDSNKSSVGGHEIQVGVSEFPEITDNFVTVSIRARKIFFKCKVWHI